MESAVSATPRPANHPRSAQIFLKKKGEEKRKKIWFPLYLLDRERARERERVLPSQKVRVLDLTRARLYLSLSPVNVEGIRVNSADFHQGIYLNLRSKI